MSASSASKRALFVAAFAACTFIAAISAAQEKDGARLRGGVSLTGGGFFGSASVVSYSGFLAGADGHIGVQINNLIGVYAVPHLSFGSVTQDISLLGASQSASTGWLVFSGTAVVDATFFDKLFFGAGGGFAAHGPTCVNCQGSSGPVLHIRAGGYPLMGKGENGIRRKGLMVAGDLRVNFLSSSGFSFTAIQPMLNIGYEAF